MLSWVEHEKRLISMGPDPESTLYQISLEETDIGHFSLENVHVRVISAFKMENKHHIG